MEYPLVSAICPTANRKTFLEQSITLFLRQTYPNKELIIIDNGQEPLIDVSQFTAHDLGRGIKYHRIGHKHSIGNLRNIACELATGELLCLWDDDDYFSPHRLSMQAEPILRGHASVTACKMELLLDARTNSLYRCSDEVHDALFRNGIRSNTLMFEASYWRGGLYYEDSSSGEDTQYFLDLIECGATLQRIVDDTAFISVRHGSNVSDALAYSDGWEQVKVSDYLPVEDRAFYEQFRDKVTVNV